MKSGLLFCAPLLLLISALFAQSNPVPHVNDPLVPGSALPGSAAFDMTINGAGFVAGSVANWNGTALKTRFVTGSRLQARVPGSYLATPATALVTVANPSPGGGLSNVALFSITIPSSSVSLSRQDIFFSANALGNSVGVGDFRRNNSLDVAVILEHGINYALNLAIYLNNNGVLQPGQLLIPRRVGAGEIGIGDFNGDGILDLAAADDGGITVFPGNGDGTFTTGGTYAAGITPYSLAVGDFNKDGKLDVAVADFNNDALCILLGNGDGTLQAAATYPTGRNPLSTIVGDFNGDGNLDVAVANTRFREDSVSVLLGKGDGTFQPQQKFSTGNNAYSVRTADLNGDAVLDLVVTGKDNPGFPMVAGVLLGNGDGTFQPHVDYPTGREPLAVALADLNGDGQLDIVTGNFADATLSVLLGKGDGTFEPQLVFPELGETQFAFADLNNDGRIEVLGVAVNALSIYSQK
jgi:hypothetical protein